MASGKWVCQANKSAKQMSLPGKWVCQARESARQGNLQGKWVCRQVGLPGKWVCQASESARQVSLQCTAAARQAVCYMSGMPWLRGVANMEDLHNIRCDIKHYKYISFFPILCFSIPLCQKHLVHPLAVHVYNLSRNALLDWEIFIYVYTNAWGIVTRKSGGNLRNYWRSSTDGNNIVANPAF
jgi:hypothetical protein